MRKVVMFNSISLEGFFETLDHRIDWVNTDAEFNKFTTENAQSDDVDGFILGRKTYDMMSSFWPTEFALQSNPVVARRMNELPKYVFSRTLKSVDWSNSELVKGDAVQELKRIKHLPGKDLVIFGSGNLSKTFINNDLIDEFQLIVNPILLASGTPLFQDLNNSVRLKLLNVRTFGNGNVLMIYQPDRTTTSDAA
ncbi:MAG TPA: dihydrofolate reductase family protein [Bellilinea sp.]